MEPPGKDRPRAVDGHVSSHEPGGAELLLMAEHSRAQLRRRPYAQHYDGKDDENLADQQRGGSHGIRSGKAASSWSAKTRIDRRSGDSAAPAQLAAANGSWRTSAAAIYCMFVA